MPQIAVSKELLQGIKQYLVDVEGLTIGEFVAEAVFFAFEHLKEFEAFLGLMRTEEAEEEKEIEDEIEEEED